MVQWKVGKEFCIGYELMMDYEENAILSGISYRGICFRLLILKKGTLIITINGKNTVINAPAILCLNDKDEITINSTSAYELSIIYFHPNVINSSFDLENIFQDKFEGDPHFLFIRTEHGFFRLFKGQTVI